MSAPVLIYANSAWYIYNFRRDLICSILDAGYEVVALAPKDEYSERIGDLGCKFIHLPMDSKGTSLLNDLILLWRIFRIIKSVGPSIIFTFTIKCNIYTSLVGSLLRVPVLPNVSGLGSAFSKNSWLAKFVVALYRITFKHAPKIFFQNSGDQELFVKLGIAKKSQACLLPGSGVDLKRFSPTKLPESGVENFILIARLLWDKGVGEFVEAAKLIHRKNPAVKFKVLGFLNVKSRNAIDQKTVNNWVDSGNIVYLGQSDDVRPHIAQADCVVLPSYYPEGTPRSLLEAAAMARPIITTNTPGCRDVVEDGITGFLCKPKDVTSLYQAMERFIECTPTARAKMGKLGRSKMEMQYDQSIVIEAYIEEIKCRAESVSIN